MTDIPGVDYAWSHPGGKALQTAKKRFACRYLSKDAAKNLSRPEADDLAEHGVSCVVVWETTANRALGGRAAGISDAHAALTQATAAGMPSGRPIFFAVDWNATEAQQAAINAYFDGAASVLGAARVGIYGGYYPVKRALDGKHAAWAWQTIAWSGGLWDPRAQIRQGAQKKINGVSCDLNTATATDYGQWMPGETPEVDVDLTKDNLNAIQNAVWTRTWNSPTTGKPTMMGTFLAWNDKQTQALTKAVQDGSAATATAVVKALTPLIGKNVDTATVVAAVEAAIATAVVHVNVDVTGDQPAA